MNSDTANRGSTMSDMIYFVSGSQGQWEFSNGAEQIGHIEQVGMQFTIKPTPGSILEGLQGGSYTFKQEAVEAIELHTGKICKPAAS
jgi:hypothetical protein